MCRRLVLTNGNNVKQYYFISGLPRSGSTLLASILKQNPSFHASISDNLLTHFRTQIECASDAHSSDYNEEQLKAILRGTVDGFYHNITAPIVFNTNRLWTNLLPEIKALYPYTKIICCVRDITRIIDSFERLHQHNPFLISTIYGKDHDITAYTRAASLMAERSVIRLPYDSLKSAITGPYYKELLLVEYDLLTKNPHGVMKTVYDFINQPYFEHDFNNVATSYGEYDNSVRTQGLHTTKKQVEQNTKGYIIPPDIINQYSGLEVWRY